VLISIVGGVVPALLWLLFWLKEDRLHPEPKRRIIATFLAGMVSVIVALLLEKLIFSAIVPDISNLGISVISTITIWAIIEELLKYIAAKKSALLTRDMDEPIDAVIYMITAALGFSAIENALFLTKLIDGGYLVQSILTGSSRFIGASLLHVASSAAIGVMIGLSYYKKTSVKKFFLFTGIIISIFLHTIFNLLIIKFDNDLFFIFAGVWFLIIFLIILIEKVKKTTY